MKLTKGVLHIYLKINNSYVKDDFGIFREHNIRKNFCALLGLNMKNIKKKNDFKNVKKIHGVMGNLKHILEKILRKNTCYIKNNQEDEFSAPLSLMP